MFSCYFSVFFFFQILDLSDVIFINHSLPQDMQSEWSLLFSTRIHGLSFTSMLGKITNKGPTVIIIEDTKQNLFGGFSSDSWRLGPKFFGKFTYFHMSLKLLECQHMHPAHYFSCICQEILNVFSSNWGHLCRCTQLQATMIIICTSISSNKPCQMAW